MKSYKELKTYDELVSFQRMMAKKYPYYPVKEENWGRMNEYVITIKGLEQLKILKSQTVMGNYTCEDITLFIALLELYASTNPSKERLQEHKKYLDFYFGDLLKTRYTPDLINEGLAIKNEKYDPKFREAWSVWSMNIINECWRLKELEGN